MPETQGQISPDTPAEPIPGGTPQANPQDLPDIGPQAGIDIAPKSLPELDFPEDPLDGIPTDQLPEGRREQVEKNIRDGWLRLSSKVDKVVKKLEEREAQYMAAIQGLATSQSKPAAATEPHGEESPEEIVRRIAEERAQEIFDKKIKSMGLDATKDRSDAMLRQLQILEAKTIYPDLDRYQAQLVQLGDALEAEIGHEKALLFPVTDLMHIIRGREAVAKRRRLSQTGSPLGTQQPQAPGSPAQVARNGVAPGSVAPPAETPSTMLEAFRLAQKQHGKYVPTLNR